MKGEAETDKQADSFHPSATPRERQVSAGTLGRPTDSGLKCSPAFWKQGHTRWQPDSRPKLLILFPGDGKHDSLINVAIFIGWWQISKSKTGSKTT